MNLTKNEIALLNWIALNEMTPVNGATPECADDTICYFWAGDFAASAGLSTQAARGVASSLSKKGLAYFDECDGETDTGLTEEGFKAWQSIARS